MKKIVACLTMTLGLLATALVVQTKAENIEIHTFDYPPFMDMSDPMDGLLGKIIHAAFNEVGIEPKFIYYPPLRMFNLYIGAQDVLACVGPVTLIQRQTPDKRKQVIGFPPMVNIIMAFLYHLPTHGNKPTAYEKLSELSGYRVGVIRGSNTISVLKENGIDVIETSIQSQMKMLKGGRIDYCAISFLTGRELLKTLFPKNTNDFAFMEKPIMELPSSIYFNKGFPESEQYAINFEKGFNTIVNNGRYLQILESYYGKNNIPGEYQPLFDSFGIWYFH